MFKLKFLFTIYIFNYYVKLTEPNKSVVSILFNYKVHTI